MPGVKHEEIVKVILQSARLRTSSESALPPPLGGLFHTLVTLKLAWNPPSSGFFPLFPLNVKHRPLTLERVKPFIGHQGEEEAQEGKACEQGQFRAHGSRAPGPPSCQLSSKRSFQLEVWGREGLQEEALLPL